MEKIRESLEERKQQLLQIKRQKEDALKNTPEGSLRICNNKGKIQYYRRTNAKDFNGTYIREQDKEIAYQLAQKDYDRKILEDIKKELGATERYLASTKSLKAKYIYENLHQERRKLVNPIRIPDCEFIRDWELVEYEGKEFVEGTPEFYTTKGERVRSKSEVMIADMLDKERIPYRYEYPIYLKGVGVVYPDFTILNKASRKEMYWEHLGMMDDPNYAESVIRKITSYEQNGIFPGKDLILTYESKKNPLNSKIIKLMVQCYLK